MPSRRHDGLSYELALPAEAPVGAVVILHGAGSCKENHRDFALRCSAVGLAAAVYDQRGHGASGGELDGRALDDVAAIAGLLPRDVPLFLRGSSMGGFAALAAAERCGAAGVVAICPAAPELLRAGLRNGGLGFRADAAALTALLAGCDLEAAAGALGPRLLLIHAAGDERVPLAHSERLHAAAPGSRLIAVPGGDHRSVQHDGDLQEQAVSFLLDLAAQA